MSGRDALGVTLLIVLSFILYSGLTQQNNVNAEHSRAPLQARLPLYSPPPPRYDWKPEINERVSLNPAMVWTMTFTASEPRLKVIVDASSAVNFEMQPGCSGSPRTLHTEQICNVGTGNDRTPVQLRITDARTPEGAGGKTLLGIWTKSKTLSEQAIASNAVNLTISRWTCIENCAP